MKSILENVLGGLSNNYVPIQIICAKEYLLRISQVRIRKQRQLPRSCILGEGLKHCILYSVV